GHWALAITSFNHGTRNLPRLEPEEAEFSQFAHLFDSCSKKRHKKRLGYASRNYYAEYLAVVHAEAYRNLFYGEPPTDPIQPIVFHKVNQSRNAVELANQYTIPLQRFRLSNPDVLNVQTRLPRGLLVAMPGEHDDLAMLRRIKPLSRRAM